MTSAGSEVRLIGIGGRSIGGVMADRKRHAAQLFPSSVFVCLSLSPSPRPSSSPALSVSALFYLPLIPTYYTLYSSSSAASIHLPTLSSLYMRLRRSWFSRLYFCGRCSNLEFTITTTILFQSIPPFLHSSTHSFVLTSSSSSC